MVGNRILKVLEGMSSPLPSLLLEYISLHSSARISAVSQMIPFLWIYKPPKIPLNLLSAANKNMFWMDILTV